MNAIRNVARGFCTSAILTLASIGAHASSLTVTHWGDGMYGVPFAVALDKGYFKEEKVDVTGFITSEGGGTSIRNAMASDIPYGEVALPAAIAAVKQGVDLTIVHGGVQSLGDLVWVQMKNGTINNIKEMKGQDDWIQQPQIDDRHDLHHRARPRWIAGTGATQTGGQFERHAYFASAGRGGCRLHDRAVI